MAMASEQELWAVALWVEREHAEWGEQFIAERVLHFDQVGNSAGRDLWMNIARRFSNLQLTATRIPN